MATVAPFVEIKNFKGIDNVNDVLSLDNGFLKEGNNVDIDNKNLISVRNGYSLKQSGNFHSLFGGSNILLAVHDNDLVKISDDFLSYEVLREDVGTTSMSYVEINNKIYYTNNVVIGYIDNGESKTFSEPEETGRVTLPAGHMIEYYHGRLYVARGNVLYCSDAMNLEQMQARKGFIQMNGRITMLQAVTDGLFVSDGNIKFLFGNTPNEFAVKLLANYDVIENSAVKIDGSYLNLGNPIDSKVIYMVTEKGMAVGLNGGQFLNLTSNYYSDITGNRGAGVHKNENGKSQYIGIIKED